MGGESSSISADTFSNLTRPICAFGADMVMDGLRCPLVPKIPCEWCKLVAYCSEKCKEVHWPIHKTTCAGRRPRVTNVYEDVDIATLDQGPPFWSSYPAMDVLKLETTEGLSYTGRLCLLFLDRSGLRHFIYSIAKLPSKPNCSIYAVVRENGMDRFARMFFGMLLLTDTTHNTFANAEAFVHLWYSTRLPKGLLARIRKIAEPMFRSARQVLAKQAEHTLKSTPLRLAMSGKLAKVSTCLTTDQWADLFDFLNPDSQIPHALVDFQRKVDAEKRPEMLAIDRELYTPGRAVCLDRWAEDGMLLPYDHSRINYTDPNPIFFWKKLPYPCGASMEPLTEWSLELLDYNFPLAHEGCILPPNDVYRKMFYYVRDLCVIFQHRLRKIDVHIDLLAHDLEDVVVKLSRQDNSPGFDRIEASTLYDESQLHLMTSMCSLLRPRALSPHARLLTLTRESLDIDAFVNMEEALSVEERNIIRYKNDVVNKFAPLPKAGNPNRQVALLRLRMLLMHFHDWGHYSDIFLSHPRSASFLHEEKGSDTLWENLLGWKLHAENTIAPCWIPDRVAFYHNPILRDFNRWISSPDRVPKRWLEWSFTSALMPKERNLWHALGVKIHRAGKEGDSKNYFEYFTLAQKLIQKHFLFYDYPEPKTMVEDLEDESKCPSYSSQVGSEEMSQLGRDGTEDEEVLAQSKEDWLAGLEKVVDNCDAVLERLLQEEEVKELQGETRDCADQEQAETQVSEAKSQRDETRSQRDEKRAQLEAMQNKLDVLRALFQKAYREAEAGVPQGELLDELLAANLGPTTEAEEVDNPTKSTMVLIWQSYIDFENQIIAFVEKYKELEASGSGTSASRSGSDHEIARDEQLLQGQVGETEEQDAGAAAAVGQDKPEIKSSGNADETSTTVTGEIDEGEEQDAGTSAIVSQDNSKTKNLGDADETRTMIAGEISETGDQDTDTSGVAGQDESETKNSGEADTSVIGEMDTGNPIESMKPIISDGAEMNPAGTGQIDDKDAGTDQQEDDVV